MIIFQIWMRIIWSTIKRMKNCCILSYLCVLVFLIIIYEFTDLCVEDLSFKIQFITSKLTCLMFSFFHLYHCHCAILWFICTGPSMAMDRIFLWSFCCSLHLHIFFLLFFYENKNVWCLPDYLLLWLQCAVCYSYRRNVWFVLFLQRYKPVC